MPTGSPTFLTDDELKTIERMRKEKSHEEYQYLHLIDDIINTGYEQNDRTGVGTYTKHGANLRFSLRNNTLPVITSRKTFFRGAVEELLWLLRGETSVESLQKNNIHIWDGNTTKEFIEQRGLKDIVPINDIGALYGFQIRNWNGDYKEWIQSKKRTGIDQLYKLIDGLKHNPNGRRHLISNYCVNMCHLGVLEPCHTFYSFNINQEKNELNSLLFMRSCDIMCGAPLNFLHISLLNRILSKMLGYTPGDFVFQGSNVHLYKSHVENAKIQIQREPYQFPKINIKKDIKTIEDIENLKFEDFELIDYKYHPPLKYEMAI